jgi:hypothetical protein
MVVIQLDALAAIGALHNHAERRRAFLTSYLLRKAASVCEVSSHREDYPEMMRLDMGWIADRLVAIANREVEAAEVADPEEAWP